MACDTRPRGKQTLSERKQEVRDAIASLVRQLVSGRVKPVVGPQGAITFQGWQDNPDVTDACAYRMLMISGTAQAKLAVQKAEMLAGRSVNKQALAHGTHSHDGGRTWHNGH